MKVVNLVSLEVENYTLLDKFIAIEQYGARFLANLKLFGQKYRQIHDKSMVAQLDCSRVFEVASKSGDLSQLAYFLSLIRWLTTGLLPIYRFVFQGASVWKKLALCYLGQGRHITIIFEASAQEHSFPKESQGLSGGVWSSLASWAGFGPVAGGNLQISTLYVRSYNQIIIMSMLQVPGYDLDLARSRYSFDVKSETSTEGEENDFSPEYQSPIKAPFRHTCSKAKTSLCKNFTEKGYCSYGKKCQFAHGPEQLRVNMEHNRSYKTKGCHAFSKKGYCCYGERCNFIHEQGCSQTASQRWAAIYSNHRDTIHPSEYKESSRLLALLRL